MLALTSRAAILVQDIGLVVGISGALLGAAIVYIFPALIYGSARLAELRDAQRDGRNESATLELGITYSLVPLGLFLGVLGVWMTLQI